MPAGPIKIVDTHTLEQQSEDADRRTRKPQKGYLDQAKDALADYGHVARPALAVAGNTAGAVLGAIGLGVTHGAATPLVAPVLAYQASEAY